MITSQLIKYFKEFKERLNYKLSHLDIEDEEEIDELEHDLMKLHFRERAAYATDLIQPGSSKFKTYYKEEWLKLEKEKEEAELKTKRIEKEREQFYKDNILEGKAKVTNALELEDKIRYAK